MARSIHKAIRNLSAGQVAVVRSRSAPYSRKAPVGSSRESGPLSKTDEGNLVRVQLPLSAPCKSTMNVRMLRG